ncbi:MAG: hypothetical protein H6708_27555 [Kofleriaceae bacterium]|nr:hypothetical protein [Myxococcales bacterium]MCB9564164.1 hypothetical protein [Kofleriaceae bacterium]
MSRPPRLALFLGLILALAFAARIGHAAPPPPPPSSPPGAAPLRIAIECQGWGRTKACPAFLLGFVEHDPLFLSSPRSDADVVLYYNVTPIANADHVQLRFVGDLRGAPPVVEIEVDLDTRGDDDTQRGQLQPAFVRGVALYVAALHPDAVAITLEAPAAPVVAPATSPWGFEAQLGGYGSWTHGYQSVNGWGSLGVSRIDARSQLSLSVSSNFGLSHQPPLIIDGAEVSLDTDQYSVGTDVFAERHLDPHWSVAATSSLWHEDPAGQFRLTWQGRGGIEWDHFPADDPRGNRLAVAYLAGWQVDRYNVRNELDERFAQYPIHGLSAGGTIRKDKIGVGLYLSVRGEVLHPARRHTVSASPFIEWTLGAHVDLSLSLSVTERALPGPADLDESSYEQITRAAYAEPLSAYGSFNLRFHWDRTNGQRNDRFSDAH